MHIFKSTLIVFFLLLSIKAASYGSEVEIRPLSPKDWECFRDLRLKALRENPIAYGIAVSDESKRSDDEWKTMCQDSWEGKNLGYCVADYEGRLVGILGAEAQNDSYMSHLVEIVAAYVDPDFRRTGVMKHLFQAIKDRLLENPNIEQLIAWVTLHEHQTGRDVFENFGFTYAGTLARCVKYEGLFYDCCWLELPLRIEEKP